MSNVPSPDRSPASEEPVTILYLDHTGRWSGGEIALLRMLEALDRRRFTPLVLLAEEGPFADRLRERGIETQIEPLSEQVREVRKDSLGLGRLLVHGIRAGLSLIRYAARIARIARARRVALIHCNSLKSDIYGALAARLARVPSLWHIRDHINPTYLPGAAVRALRALSRGVPTFVVTNSQSTLDTLHLPDTPRQHARVRVVHDGLDPADLNAPPPAAATAWQTTSLRIGIVGRITAWKGQQIFLQAADLLMTSRHYNEPAAVATAAPALHFLIIGAPLFGEEAYEQELRNAADALPAGAVEFLGFRDDIPAVLRSLDILVHASITPEPFGQVVIEGMAAGLPVIATNGGGVQEIITDGDNGLLVPMGDADALARALKRLIDDPATANRLARAGYAHVRTAFTAAQSARKIEAVYDTIRSVSGGCAPNHLHPRTPASLVETRRDT